MACKTGRLDLLQYAIDNGAPWHNSALLFAIEHTTRQATEDLRPDQTSGSREPEPEPSPGPEISTRSRSFDGNASDQLALIRCCCENNCPQHSEAFVLAATRGGPLALEVLEYLYNETECPRFISPWATRAMAMATVHDQDKCVRWLVRIVTTISVSLATFLHSQRCGCFLFVSLSSSDLHPLSDRDCFSNPSQFRASYNCSNIQYLVASTQLSGIKVTDSCGFSRPAWKYPIVAVDA